MKTITQIVALLLVAGISTNILKAEEVSLAMPNKGISNFTVSAGFTMTRASIGGEQLGTTPNVDGRLNLYGGTVALGWRFHRHHGLQVTTGYLANSASGEVLGMHCEERDVALPLLLSYNFYIPWTEANDAVELRISPTAGLMHFNSDINIDDDGWLDDNDTTYVFGLGIGLTFHLDSKYYLDVAYRYLRTGKIKIFDIDIGAADTHSLTFSVGMKF